MRVKLIRIGNSKGIRIPKGLIDQCDLRDPVELSASEGTLMIRSVQKPRMNWDEAFKTMSENRDDVMLDDLAGGRWDQEEWEW